MIALLKENKIFRVLLGYRFFSGLGGGIFQIFMLLSVHLIYENPIYTGIAGFLVAVPFIFSFAVGPVVDKSKKSTILRWTTLLEFAALALLAFTPLHDQIGILFMFAVILVFSTAALFESPSKIALLPQIISDENIVKANSLIQIVQLVGGLGVAALLFITLRDGANANFSFIYGVSAVFLIIAFMLALFLKEPDKKEVDAESETSNYLSDLKAGAKFIRHNVLLFLLIAAVSMSVFAEIASVNRPEFYEYYAGAQGYIIFMIMALIGGIIASVLAGTLGNNFRVGRLLFVLLIMTGAIRIVFVMVIPNSLIGAYIIAILYAAISGPIDIALESLAQKIPPKEMVGRVDTIATTIAAIFVAIGALLGGLLGSIVSDVDYIFIFQGISFGVIGIFILLVPSIRKLPKMAEIGKPEKQKEEHFSKG